MRENLVRTKLREGKPVFGVISPTSDPTIAEYIGYAGFDFYMIDGEHGAITPAQALNLIRACDATGITPLARVNSLDPKLILQFMDAGTMGVMMPGCNTVQDVERLVAAMKYPPMGERGLGPARASEYMMSKMAQKDQLHYVQVANEQTLVLPQVEDIKAMEHLEAMCRVPGVDGFIIGPRDLAMTMDFYDGPNHDEVKKVIDEIFRIVLSAGLTLGTVAATHDQAKQLVAKGAKILLNSVAGLLGQSAKAFLSQ